MPLNIKSSGGGEVILDSPTTASNITVTLPKSNLDLGNMSDDVLASGEASVSRTSPLYSTAALASGTLNLTFARATKTETINNLISATTGTAAAATPTLCRLGVYQLNESTNEVTLVASTANDTALWAATHTTYTKALSSPWNKVAGVVYGYGVLCVSGVARPILLGAGDIGTSASAATALFRPPMRCAQITGLSDLPASSTSLVSSPIRHYIVATP